MRKFIAFTAAALLLSGVSAIAQGSGSSGDIGGTAVSPTGAGATQGRQPSTTATGIGSNSTGTTSGASPRTKDASEQRMKSDTDTRRGSKPDGTQ